MVTQEMVRTKPKLLTADDIWEMECDPANEDRYFYLIDGELCEDPMPNLIHMDLAGKFVHQLVDFGAPRNIGVVGPEGSFSLSKRSSTYLRPDVSFTRYERLANSQDYSFIRAMPDIAVEIKSPSNTYAEQRRKAQAYLRHGSTLVWLVFPERKGVEVWSLDEYGDMQSQFVDRHGALRGDPALPGFSLELSKLFPPEHDGDEHAR